MQLFLFFVFHLITVTFFVAVDVRRRSNPRWFRVRRLDERVVSFRRFIFSRGFVVVDDRFAVVVVLGSFVILGVRRRAQEYYLKHEVKSI